jgi:hypothetical protein
MANPSKGVEGVYNYYKWKAKEFCPLFLWNQKEIKGNWEYE